MLAMHFTNALVYIVSSSACSLYLSKHTAALNGQHFLKGSSHPPQAVAILLVTLSEVAVSRRASRSKSQGDSNKQRLSTEPNSSVLQNYSRSIRGARAGLPYLVY
ncbi:hypothetical protein V8C44DRAFT_283036 [Trichoderma aethiopicum]